MGGIADRLPVITEAWLCKISIFVDLNFPSFPIHYLFVTNLEELMLILDRILAFVEDLVGYFIVPSLIPDQHILVGNQCFIAE